MDSNPELKKSKFGCIDRISELPDLILEKILSFLPAKNAVSASILSTSWKNLNPFGFPPAILDLDFDDSILLYPEGNDPDSRYRSFMVFVDKLLNETLRGLHCMDEVILKCKSHCGDDAKFISWVSAAVHLNVRFLVLECYLFDSETLFHSLNGCTTLKRLMLTGNFNLYIPKKISIPNLKTLEMFDLKFSYRDNDEGEAFEPDIMMTLIKACPALENISLTDCDSQSLENLCIKSPLLKTLIIQNSLSISCQVRIDAPNLVLLLLEDCTARTYKISRFNSLKSAHIDVGPSDLQLDEYDLNYGDEDKLLYDYDLRHLVIGCCNAEHLYLSTSSMECFHYATDRLPQFQNLIWLSLACVNGSHGWMLLACLLYKAPYLEKLVFEKGFKEYEDGYLNFLLALSSTPPVCLESHLKEIELWEFSEQEDEITLIEYFLKNGIVLQKLKLYSPPIGDTDILRRLRKCPRGSKVIVEMK